MQNSIEYYLSLLEREAADGRSVIQLYCDALAIRERLGRRLGTDADDPDVVALVEACEAIHMHLLLRPYKGL